MVSRIPTGWVPLEAQLIDRLYSLVTPVALRKHGRQFCVLYVDDERLSRTERLEDSLDAFESDLDLHIAANSRRPLFVHAGAVKWGPHVILMPGPSQSGKTTLVAEFLRAGASYYSDDFALINDDGHIVPHRRPLSVRLGNGGVQKLDPEDLGAKTAAPARVSTVLFMQYASDSCWSPKKVSQGQAMLRLLQNTPGARKSPSLAMEMLGSTVKNAESYVGFRGEKADTVERVLHHLDHRSFL